MNPHLPMTNNDCDLPALLVVTQAPLDVLHSNAATRFLAGTQMMESLASLDITQAKGADVQQLANAAAMLLRDGCDVMDVLGGGFGLGCNKIQLTALTGRGLIATKLLPQGVCCARKIFARRRSAKRPLHSTWMLTDPPLSPASRSRAHTSGA
jgi:hypothetical protein